MNRRTSLTTVALLCFTVALPAGDAAGQQKTLKDQLAGPWTYVSSEITLPDGTKQPSVFGANPKGILILDAGGRYADIEMRPDRPKFKASGNFRVNTPPAEWGEAPTSNFRPRIPTAASRFMDMAGLMIGVIPAALASNTHKIKNGSMAIPAAEGRCVFAPALTVRIGKASRAVIW
jgi:hypothetical protein